MAETTEATYNGQEDADGFICWMHINAFANDNSHRLAAMSALLSAAKVDFKVVSNGTEWTTIHVRKGDTKSLEILWNLTTLVDIQAPPVLRIIVPPDLKDIEPAPFEPVPEQSRFDII